MSRELIETWRLTEDLAAPWLRAADHAQKVELPKGSLLYSQGETSTYFWFLLSGQMQVSIIRRDGQEFVVDVFGPISLCGEAPAFDGMPRFTTGQILRDATFLRFDVRRLRELFAGDAELPLSLLKITSMKQRVVAVRLQYLGPSAVEDRVGDILLRLAEGYPEGNERGRVIRIHLSHAKLAAMTGASRVTVTRTLKRLRTEGVIEIDQGFIRILNPSALQG